MSEEAAFLSALKANPADDTARLVYADWLDEHDQPRKAEYLRAVVEVARAPNLTHAAVVERIATIALRIAPDWRMDAAARFGLTFLPVDPARRFDAYKLVRELTGIGIGRAKPIIETAPQPIPFRSTLEVAHAVTEHHGFFELRALGSNDSPALTESLATCSATVQLFAPDADPSDYEVTFPDEAWKAFGAFLAREFACSQREGEWRARHSNGYVEIAQDWEFMAVMLSWSSWSVALAEACAGQEWEFRFLRHFYVKKRPQETK